MGPGASVGPGTVGIVRCVWSTMAALTLSEAQIRSSNNVPAIERLQRLTAETFTIALQQTILLFDHAGPRVAH